MRNKPIDEPFRLCLETRDGIKIVNRMANKSYYVDGALVDHTFAKHALERECREKGVKLLNYLVTQGEVHAYVDWL